MGAVLRQFSNLLNPGPFQLPLGPLQVDWTHPISAGMIGCWVPAVMGTNNLGSANQPMSWGPGTTKKFDVNIHGPGTYNVTAGAGLNGTAAADFKFTDEFSGFWCGYKIGNGGYGYTPVIGVEISNNYDIYAPGISVSSDAYFYLRCGASGANTKFSSACTIPAMNTAGFSLKVATTGPCLGYLNGLNAASTVWGSTAVPSWTTTSQVCIDCYPPYNHPVVWTNTITNIACFWNRVLSADEMLWLDRNPYGFLIPAEFDVSTLFAGAAFLSAWARQTNLPVLGTGIY